MLGAMRKSSIALKIVLWFVIFAFMATIVVVWGVGSKQTDFSYAAKVGDKVIGMQEFQNYYRTAIEQIRQLNGSVASDSEMTPLVMAEMVERELLLMEADRLNVPVSDAEVVSLIVATPLFQNETGEFDVEKYQQSISIAPRQYEEYVRDEIKMNKMLELIYGSVAVNQDEIAREYSYLNTRLSVSHFTVSPFDYLQTSSPTDEELAKFYEDNKERYRVPARIKLKYLLFDKAEWSQAVDFAPDFTEDDVQMRYTTDISLYSQPQQADISQILFADQAKADEALAALEGGENFDAVAERYSPDTAAFMGRIMNSNTGSEMENELFALKNGEYSKIYPTEYGFHIYKIDNKTEASVLPFSIVRNDIVKKMTDEAIDYAYRNALNIQYLDIVKAGNISAYANTADNITVYESDFIYENEPSPLFGTDPEVKNMLFTMGRTELSGLTDVDNKTYLYEVAEKESSYIPALDAVKDKVLAEYNMYESFQAASEDVYSKIGDKPMTVAEFAAAAAEFGRPVTPEPSLSRSGALANIPSNANLINSLFAAKENDVVKYIDPASNGIYVIRVAGFTKASETIPAEEEEALRSFLISVKQADAKKWKVEELKKRYQVEINPMYVVAE